MPRIFRILPEEGVLHILTRGNNKQKVFEDELDYKAYHTFLKTYKQEHKFLLYHYCLMPNHIHLIIETTLHTNLAKLMKQINLAYLYHYKRRYGYCGHLWQGRYKSLLISRDEYLITCGRYIELNPVRAKIAKDPKDYQWSSYNVYAYGKKDDITDYNPIYNQLGKTDALRQRNYREHIQDGLERINLNMRFLGPEDYISEMVKEFKIPNLRGKKGRPKNENK